MTEQRRPDDRLGDASVDAAWRAAAREQPPPGIDATILAAAREAVSREVRHPTATPRAQRWKRWQPLAAAAGVVGLSLLLVQNLPRETPTPAPAARELSGPGSVEAPAQPPAGLPAPARSPARDSATAVSAERQAAPGPAVAPAYEAAAKASDAASPEAPASWASRVAALHDAGEIAAAQAELRAFRAVYADADAYLPERLRVWAASIGRDGEP